MKKPTFFTVGESTFQVVEESATEDEPQDLKVEQCNYEPMLLNFKVWLTSIKDNFNQTASENNLILACYDHRHKLNKTSAAAIMYTISEYCLHKDRRFDFIKLKRSAITEMFRTTEGMFQGAFIHIRRQIETGLNINTEALEKL